MLSKKEMESIKFLKEQYQLGVITQSEAIFRSLNVLKDINTGVNTLVKDINSFLFIGNNGIDY